LFYVSNPAGLGSLYGHVARNNPLWQVQPEEQLLVVFQGPSSYITPNWYASKQHTGKVVPTWNYAVVHAYCSLCAIHNPDRLLGIISEQTDLQEANQLHPWKVSDAPTEFTEMLLKDIVGIHLRIDRWGGIWKVSQNQPRQNQQSLVEGLLETNLSPQIDMATLIRLHGCT
jgi:transcriptional regulator